MRINRFPSLKPQDVKNRLILISYVANKLCVLRVKIADVSIVIIS